MKMLQEPDEELLVAFHIADKLYQRVAPGERSVKIESVYGHRK